MKYPDRMARRGAGSRPFHTAISTTFAIEFAALEEVMLPQLMTSGATNLLVIADRRMASMSLSDGSQMPVQLGRDYELYSPRIGAGVFHPKIILQIGRRAGRLFVGSANITAAGLAGNAETVIELECGDEPGPEREVVRAAWRYLNGLVSTDAGAARDAMTWAADRAKWLLGPEPDPVQVLEDGSAISFLSNASDVAISRRFIDFVVGEAVEQLVVASPYWDKELAALQALRTALEPEAMSIFVDPEQHAFPIRAPAASGLNIRKLPKTLQGRFAHAKIVIASTSDHDHVLVGSANCTQAALGRGEVAGVNAEACIYRRLPRNAALKALGLDTCLEQDPIEPDKVEPREAPAPIPLNEIEATWAGSFEIEQALLIWSPAPRVPKSGTLRLLDAAGREIGTISFGPIDAAARQSLRVEIDQPGRTSFIVVVSENFVSAPAHVTHRHLLRRRRREVPTGAVAKAVEAFDSGEEFDLWMHGAFDDLARADLADRPHIPVSLPRAPKLAPEQEEQVAQHLTYDEFMEMRSPDARDLGRHESALTGTHSDSIRSFLNMLVGRGSEGAEADPDDGDWLEMGDEDEDGELDAATSDIELAVAEEPDDEEANTRNAAVDARLFEKMVRSYVANVTAGEEPLGPSDVLRLRFWLMLLLYKARHTELPKGLEPTSDETGWPRMALRVLAAFFCGKKPPVTRVMISREYTEMPVDFLESWTTALWTLDAIEAVVRPSGRSRSFLTYVARVRLEMLKILGLTPTEIASEIVVELRRALDRTIGRRLAYNSVAAA
ncbi:hypothetical protein [Methylobacterium sp. WL116]|uniref:hypothetical protein n=1 Tax=Methylobacterium sp. WL116 TaxID=2603889 RepID=UPI0011C79938|nr:hypothetical protein [Methylobacterium sp. WL116]TXM94674.1 hypothetical protein FV223_03770 [Methylobacterium sp. WL116]